MKQDAAFKKFWVKSVNNYLQKPVTKQTNFLTL